MGLGKRELILIAVARIRDLYLGLIGRSARITVLAYHRIYEIGNENEFAYDLELVSATPGDFSWQMEFVRRYFDVITFEQLIESLERASPLPARALIITFDDGHRDNYEHAFPVLRRLGLPATIFLSTAYIGGQNTFWFDRVSYLIYHAPRGTLAIPDISFSVDLQDVRTRREATERLIQIMKRVRNGDRLEILRHLERLVPLAPRDDAGRSGVLNWEQVREMSEAGIEFGSHTMTHPVLTALDDDELDRELRESRRTIEQKTGKACDVIAYPIGGTGTFDERVTAAARRSGYKLGVSYVSGTNPVRRLEPFAIRRLHVERYTSRAAFKFMLAVPAVIRFAMKHYAEQVSVRVAPNEDYPDKAFGRAGSDRFGHGGWQYLLDLRRSDASVLCYDCTEGATSLLLSRLYRHVTVINARAEQLEKIERRLAREGVTAVSYRIVRQAADFLLLDDAPFDGIVIHDLGARIVRSARDGGSLLSLEYLLKGAHAVLAPDGFAYIGMRNRHSYLRLRDGWRNAADRRSLTADAGKRALAAAGFRAIASYPLLLEGTRVAEMIPRGGYRSATGAFAFSEKFKQIALSRWGAPHFASGYGLVAHKDDAPRQSALDRLLNGHAVFGLPIPPGRHELKRYLVLNWGKVILSIGQVSTRYGEYVVILTREEQPTLRRRREAKVLRALAARPLSLGKYIPRFLGEFAVDGANCFVMREFPGVSIDQPVPWLGELTAQAADFIGRFHSETRCAATIDEAAYSRLFGELFRSARAQNAPVAPELASLERAVRAAVMGMELPVVWVHGDYKIENLIFDDTTRELLGVIDWELSDERGLPLLDLLYLLIYNRKRRESVDLLSALGSLVLRGPKEEERGVFARYAGRVPVSASAQNVLQAMFFVHHIGVRYTYLFDSEEEVRRVREMLGLLEQTIGAEHPVGDPKRPAS